MSPNVKKGLVAGLCAGALLAAYATGALDFLRDPAAVAAYLRGAGATGMTLYLLAFTLLSGAGLPSVIFLVPMPLVWPLGTSLLLGTIGCMTSSLLSFFVARYVVRDFVASRLPESLVRFDERLTQHGLRTVIVIRLIFFLIPPASWFLALSSISWTTFALGTFIGSIPGIVVFVAVGGSFFGWLAERPPWTWAAAAIALLIFVILRRRFGLKKHSS